MTASITSITPSASALGAVPAIQSTHRHQSTAVRTAFTRATQPDYDTWLRHVQAAAGCTRPIRLTGRVLTVDAATGQRLTHTATAEMPDGVIYKPCGNRRGTVCPSCSTTYQNDAYQLLHAGLVGGKGVPESVTQHPAAFATFTAPSFGIVHARIVEQHTCRNRARCDCRPEPCRARRQGSADSRPCGHGQPMVCWARHEHDDPRVGQPLCLDCYDYDGHVVWNLHAGELWRRTKQAIDRELHQIAKQRGQLLRIVLPSGRWRRVSPVRVSHGKVAEYQARAAVHFHALLRLDGIELTNPDTIVPPPAGFTTDDIDAAVTAAADRVSFETIPHPVTGQAWTIGWGTQIDVDPIEMSGTGELSDRRVAGYLAKYATKSTEATGFASTRITRDNIATYTADDRHIARLIKTCWRLSRNPTPLERDTDANPYLLLENWAHMLGFGGHFLTKAPRYSVTFGHLRAARRNHRRDQDRSTELLSGAGHHPRDGQVDNVDTILTIGELTFTGTGWHTLGDAMLANTAAAQAREYARAGREETLQLHPTAASTELVAA